MAANQKRVVVKTSVSPAMKAEWQAHADDLDMTQTAFVKAMVQAGRHKIDPTRGVTARSVENDETPGVEHYKSVILDVLADDDYTSWDNLVGEVTADVETKVEAAIEALQQANQIRYSGRHSGYILTADQ